MGRVKLNLVVLAVAALVATGCGATGGGGGGTRLSLVAYSTPREAYAALIPAFQKTDAGKGVTFSQSYGASGDQRRAVAAGLPSDVVELSLAPDMTKLADAGAYLLQLFKNVPVQDKSAREALQTFVGGKGDAMIAYENEAIAAQQAGQPVDYVIPDQTILIENPIAVVTRSKHQAQARAFVDFLRSPQGQGIFADKGYRPVNEQAAGADKFPRPKGLFTIDDLGGWDQVTRTFFDRSGGVMADIEKQVGVSVGS